MNADVIFCNLIAPCKYVSSYHTYKKRIYIYVYDTYCYFDFILTLGVNGLKNDWVYFELNIINSIFYTFFKKVLDLFLRPPPPVRKVFCK